MKYKFLILFIIVSNSAVRTQNINGNNIDKKVHSLDSTIKSLYSFISGPEDKMHNWEQFKYLFKDDAEITLTIIQSSGNKTKYYLKVDEYINTYGKWLEDHGFYARETQRVISTFRHMNSVSSTYQYNYSHSGSYQGENRINLLKENNRWYISNLKWNQEVSDSNTLKDYLPKKLD